MEDVPDKGLRPVVAEGAEAADSEAAAVCPGAGLDNREALKQPGLIEDLKAGWGPVIAIWEGHAADEVIRFAGSSGGAATALAGWALAAGRMAGVVHTAARRDVPYLNKTVISCNLEQLLERTGSRYAPASPADGMPMIREAGGPCVFIGKPCDVASVQMACRLDPELDANVGLTIAIFCAGTPSTNGTLALLKQMGIDNPDRLVSLRYRGQGWPGLATAVVENRDGQTETRQLTYEESWGDVLCNHVQWRCRLCPDHTGELADISVGDPWYRKPDGEEAGSSLILARTQRGKEAVKRAIRDGYMLAEEAEAWKLPASQPNLLKARGHLWGRLLACRLMGAAAPKFRGFAMFRFWWSELSVKEKAQSVLGTMRRVVMRRLCWWNRRRMPRA